MNTEKDLLLISIVKANNALYAKQSKQYAKADKILVWTQIGNMIGITG